MTAGRELAATGRGQSACPNETRTPSSKAPAPDNRHAGWARIEILAPRVGVRRSDDAAYVVTCTADRPDRLKK